MFTANEIDLKSEKNQVVSVVSIEPEIANESRCLEKTKKSLIENFLMKSKDKNTAAQCEAAQELENLEHSFSMLATALLKATKDKASIVPCMAARALENTKPFMLTAYVSSAKVGVDAIFAGASNKRIKLLFVEDDKNHIFAFNKILEQIKKSSEGEMVIDIEYATSGQEAINKFNKNLENDCFDLILMDYHMPTEDKVIKNGFDTTKKIRAILESKPQCKKVEIWGCSTEYFKMLAEEQKNIVVNKEKILEFFDVLLNKPITRADFEGKLKERFPDIFSNNRERAGIL